MREAVEAGTPPAVLLLTETWIRPELAPPALQGFVLAHAVSSPLGHNGRGRGGVAIYTNSALVGTLRVWGEAREGVAWVRLQGVSDRPLHVAACYLSPAASTAQSAEYFGLLGRDVRAALAAGHVIVGGDFNARTSSAVEVEAATGGSPLLPPAPMRRLSNDRVLNRRGRALLDFCRESGLWVGNGRLPGDTPAQYTCHSLASAGAVSIVDYFLLCPSLLSHSTLHVSPPVELMDHSALVLHVPGAVVPDVAPPVGGPCPAGPGFRVDADKLSAFVTAAAARDDSWAAVVAAADAAHSVAHLDGAVGSFDRLVVHCAATAGMLVIRDGERRPPVWFQRASRPPITASLRRRRRRALSRGEVAVAAVLNRQACAAMRKHKRQQRAAAVRQMLDWRRTCPARFYRALRGRQPPRPGSITTSQWLDAFQRRLGGSPSAPRPVQPDAGGGASPPPSPLAGLPAGDDGAAGQPPATTREALAQLHAPFSPEEVRGRAGRVQNGKAVIGPLQPAMLKAAAASLIAPLTALLNACARLGCLPHTWGVSSLVPIAKAGGDPHSPDGYRGIAIGTLAAKLYGGILHDRISAFTETAGTRSAGQAGFRQGFGCSDHTMTLRTIIERQRARGQRLYACFVDFQQAFDRVPRDLLWGKLERAGLGGWALRAVRALYASVPMCVKTPTGYSRCFYSGLGVKQGCPLSPTLFGLYIDDFEQGLMAEVGAAAATLPRWEAGGHVPPLLYADDKALLATEAAGLRRQLQYLALYCSRWGLTVNAVKTKVVVFAAAAPRAVEQFHYAGEVVERVPSFTYLGVEFHSTRTFCVAAEARARAGKQATHVLQRRMSQCGLTAHPLLAMSLFDQFVKPALGYGVEVWGPRLVGAALGPRGGGACEAVHLAFLRRQLGVRDSTPSLTVLAETGRMPLAVRWAVQITRFLTRLQDMPDSRLAKQALMDSVALAAAGGSAGRGKRCWAAEVGSLLSMLGMGTALLEGQLPGALRDAVVARRAAAVHCARYAASSPMVERYVEQVRGAAVTAATYRPARYLLAVPARRDRRDLSRVRLGCSWVAEDAGRLRDLPRDQRPCPHCDGDHLGSAEHTLLRCPHYADLREQFPTLLTPGVTYAQLLHCEDQKQLARYVRLCAERGSDG